MMLLLQRLVQTSGAANGNGFGLICMRKEGRRNGNCKLCICPTVITHTTLACSVSCWAGVEIVCRQNNWDS